MDFDVYYIVGIPILKPIFLLDIVLIIAFALATATYHCIKGKEATV